MMYSYALYARHCMERDINDGNLCRKQISELNACYTQPLWFTAFFISLHFSAQSDLK